MNLFVPPCRYITVFSEDLFMNLMIHPEYNENARRFLPERSDYRRRVTLDPRRI